MKKDIVQIIKRPLVTEKVARQAEKSVYTFEVFKSANKKEIAVAFKDLYKVSPVKVTTVNIPPKNVVVRGKRGVKSGYKKAYIYLKKGEKVEI